MAKNIVIFSDGTGQIGGLRLSDVSTFGTDLRI